jgi:hypothetical protein
MSVENDEDRWWSDAEEVEESEGQLDQQLFEEAQDMLDSRAPKRNNLRRKKDDLQIATVSRLRNTATCDRCNGCDLVDDVVSASMVCRGCGSVVSRFTTADARPSVRLPSAPTPSARINYFKERIRQWCQSEPQIPSDWKRRLVCAYDALRNFDGPIQLSNVLSKPEIRAIVIEARLPPKCLVEKWVSIRSMLLQHAGLKDDYEPPTQALCNELVEKFKDYLRVWQEHPELRCGRTSLLNYNFTIANLLLMISPAAYDKHAMWFPQVTESKRNKLIPTWYEFCDLLGWPRYSAEYDRNGKLHRVRLDAAVRTSTKCRGQRAREIRRLRVPRRSTQYTLEKYFLPPPVNVQPCNNSHDLQAHPASDTD